LQNELKIYCLSVFSHICYPLKLSATFKQLNYFLSLSATAGRFASCTLVDDQDWQNVTNAVRY
jgi:hypothetical protein